VGQRRFASQDEAMRALFALRRRQSGLGWMTAYRCQFCHQFHFGHPPARVRRAIAAQRKANPFFRREDNLRALAERGVISAA